MAAMDAHTPASTDGQTLSCWHATEKPQPREPLKQALDTDAVLITRGSRGMALFEGKDRDPLMLPVYGTDQVADVTGAGDTVIAALALRCIHSITCARRSSGLSPGAQKTPSASLTGPPEARRMVCSRPW